MSYSILYDTQFIRSHNGITPVILCGDNNVYESNWRNGRSVERRCRDWSCFLNLLAVPEEELIEKAEKLTGGPYQEHWKRDGKWVDDAGLMRWVRTNIKKAANLEAIVSANSNMGAMCYLSVWNKFNNRSELTEYIHSDAHFELWLSEAKAMTEKLKEEGCSVYPVIRFWEGMRHPTANRPMPESVVIKHKYGYVCGVDATGIRFNKRIESAIIFSPEQANEILERFDDMGMRVVNAKTAETPHDVVIRATDANGSKTYVVKITSRKMQYSSHVVHAHRYSSLSMAKSAADKLTKRFAEKGWTFAPVRIDDSEALKARK